MIEHWRYLAAGVAMGLPLPAQAQQAVPLPATVPSYTMPSTQSWELRSRQGETYRILVSYPATPAPPRGFPVLYVLDGNAIFAGFAEARRIQEASDVGKSIIVGVGYPGDQAYDSRRLYDLTGGPPPQPWRASFAKERSGGWDLFLEFLTGKLRTEISTRFKIDAKRQALFGHSLGGLFAIHALYERPEAFNAIIAASPSLFWHDKEMTEAERAFAARLQAGKIPSVAKLMIVAGDSEQIASSQWSIDAFAKRMEPLSAFGMPTKSAVYIGEGHMTVPIRAVSDTLRFAFTAP